METPLGQVSTAHPAESTTLTILTRCNDSTQLTDINAMKLCIASFLIAVNLAVFASDDVAVFGIVQFTRDSTGYGYGSFETQSSPISPGVGVEYRHWLAREGKWRDQGIEVEYSVSSSGARFVNMSAPNAVIAFGLNRHAFDVDFVHRFRSDSRLVPFFKTGAGGFITNGGMAPGGILGTDGQFDLVGGAGADLRMSRHLGIRYGLTARWFRAPNFSDPGYHGSRTVILEPVAGLSWQF